MNVLIGLMLGLLFGGGVGWVLGRRAERAAYLFSGADEEEVSEALGAAQVAVAERIQKRLERIMEAATREGRITNDGVEELFCISDRTASNYLRQLTEAGRLERQGIGRGTFYTPR